MFLSIISGAASLQASRIVLGIGMGFFFIPLTTMTMSGIKKEDMGNASAIYNLLRNLGGSFGVAFVTTVLSRRAQFHQTHLAEHLTPFDNAYQSISGQSSQLLQQRGFPDTLSEQGGGWAFCTGSFSGRPRCCHSTTPFISSAY